MSDKVTELKPYAVVKYYWGAVVKHRNGNPELVILNDGQEIDLTDLEVIIHENGIEFIK